MKAKEKIKEIFPGIEIIDNQNAIYIKDIDTIAISDLQLGEELYFAEQGIFVPQIQLKEILENLKKIFENVKAKRIVINGDFKHEFGEASKQEWREVSEIIKFLKENVKEIILVRGNHDNYLLTIASRLGIKVFDPYYISKNILFTHGHKRIEFPKNIEIIIIGHEQPAIVLSHGFDRIKIPCLLYGKMKNGKKIICLPSFSPLASGVAVNIIDKEELLSPILREDVDFDELKVIGIDKEAGILRFPNIGKLKYHT
jgi:putative SbcD/Mre11-related phosphoesterase